MTFLVSPTAVAFYGVLSGELRRHSDVARAFFELGPARTLANLAALLEERGRRGELDLGADADRAAEMLVGLPPHGPDRHRSTGQGLRLWPGPLAASAPPPVAHPNPLRTLRVIGFASTFSLPVRAAQRQGFLAEEELEVRLSFTPSSMYWMTQLLDGIYDIAMTATGNVVVYQEDQSEAPIESAPKLFAFFGSDDTFLSLAVQSRIRRVDDLRGKILTVDAMTAGFAFVLHEILAHHGVRKEEVRFERAASPPASAACWRNRRTPRRCR
jgi:hypothetical protein